MIGEGPSRRSCIPPFIVMDVMREANRLAAAGRDIIHLAAGQPSTPAPAKVRDEAARLLDHPMGYTDALGLWPLRQRIARFYEERYGVAVAPERVVLTTGASGAFLLTFLACFDAGDRVAAAVPGYPSYRHILSALGIECVPLPAAAADRFQPSLRLLDEIEGRLDGLIVASPSNPTGTLIDAATFASIAGWCRDRGVRLISDEIYHGITFETPAATALALDPDAVIINSFSKYFSMTGWRLGWVVLPEPLLRATECLAQNFTVCPPSLAQHAALVAFDCQAELDANVRRYAVNRDLLLRVLPGAGIDSFAPPDGAFYLYADVGHLTDDSLGFCRRMLEEIGVAATPGLDFDPDRGHRTIRFSFAGATDRIGEAARRIGEWLR